MAVSLFAITMLLITGCSVSGDQGNSTINILSLSCENQENPNAVEQPTPCLSWKMSAGEKDQFQTAYLILVASTPELLSERKADVWDSKKVRSSASLLVPFGGKKLLSGQKYYWTVMVWDKDEKPTGYANPACWEMALTDESLWQAKWISSPRVFDYGRHEGIIHSRPKDSGIPSDPLPLFRKDFTIDKPIASAKIYISGLGFYELSVNGEKVGDHLLAPAFTDYTRKVLYEVFDLSKSVKPGKNALGVMLGNGWYNQVCNDVWSFSKAEWRADPTLLCQLEIIYTDGKKEVILSDDSWSCAPGPIEYSGLYTGETYNANMEIADWNQPYFVDSLWQKARVVRGPEGKLEAQNRPPVRILHTLEPKSITKKEEGTYVIDFGQNLAGFIRMKAKMEKGTMVRFICNELLTGDGFVDEKYNSVLIGDSRFQTDEYIFKGDGMEEWHPRFNYSGFRYVQVTGWKGELTKDNLIACSIQADIESKSSFTCSVPLINSIQSNILWTVRSNFIHFPTDCPTREKLGWTGDAQLTSSTILYNFNPVNAYAEWIDDLIQTQKASGMLSVIVPTCGWGSHKTWPPYHLMPAWNFALFEIPMNLYLYGGDPRELIKAYPAIKKYIDYIFSMSENGIVKTGLGDWVSIRTATDPIVTSTALFYKDLLIASQIAGMVRDLPGIKKYRDLAEEVKKAFNREFFDQDTGKFNYPTQTGLATGIFMDIADRDKNEMLLNELKNNILTNDFNLDFGILGAKYVPNVLAENGMKDIAFGMINTTRYPGWGDMINKGATTIWETFNGAGSRNHPAFGSIGEWFYKYLAGIKVDKEYPGFKHFFIEPWFPAEMEWVKCTKETGYGDIVVNWSKKGTEVTLDIEIPVNTTATVLLPPGTIMVDGIKPETGKTGGVISSEQTDKTNSLKLGSGSYKIALLIN
jgi:alpha-L-rhamnosidase